MSAARRHAAARGAGPRHLFLRASAAVALLLAVLSWTTGSLAGGDLFSARRRSNLERFLTEEALPAEVRDAEPGRRLGAFLEWLGPRLTGRNMEAALDTLMLAVVAATLAAAVGALLAPIAARTPAPPGPGGGLARVAGRAARWTCAGMRAVPEYVLAFLLGALLPSPAWATVIALTIHNGGILGRLYGESVENLDPRAGAALTGAGASRLQRYWAAEAPEALPRFLSYGLYRYESCVRETVVLGMLGFVSLGHWIVQERAAGRYDEVLVLVALGAAIVVAADVLSWWLRARLRRAAHRAVVRRGSAPPAIQGAPR